VQCASDAGAPAAESVRSPSDGVRIDAAGFTDVGHERRSNEDAFLIATLQRTIVIHGASPAARGWFKGEPAGTLLVVADGMGGMGGGDVASSTAVTAVTDYLLNVMPWCRVSEATPRSSVTGLREQLASTLVSADETVRQRGVEQGTPHMGTTLTMALVVWPFMYVAHVGDTRCYLLHAGALRCMTRDHNMAQKLVDDSLRDIEPPEHLQHILWNSLGAIQELPQPDVSKVELALGDVLLLCSDGLNKHVSDEQIRGVLANGRSCAARAAELVDLANAGGGSDNITAIVAQARSIEPAKNPDAG
jgi:PPM family protein phosphatase